MNVKNNRLKTEHSMKDTQNRHEIPLGENAALRPDQNSSGPDNTLDEITLLPTVITALRHAGCVFAEDEAQLLLASARTPANLAVMLDKRVAGLPLEHIIGWTDFCGLRIAVEDGVFVPRQRTAWLVQQAAALVSEHDIVVDLCCGSGAVGAVLAASNGPIELHAADIDQAAVRCARRNLLAVGGSVYQGDLFAPLPDTLRGRVNVIVANAPYVPTDAIETMPAEARLHEARVALDGGSDGLDVQRRIAAEAPSWLAQGGRLLVETSLRQSPQTVSIFAQNCLIPQVLHSDELEATVVIGTLPAR